MLANNSFRIILMGLVVAGLTPSALFAQSRFPPTPLPEQPPPPKKEAELVAAGNKPLTGQQITALLLGNTVYVMYLTPVGKWPAGTQYRAFYRDARTRVVAPRVGSTAFKKFETNWWIEGNQLCMEVQVVAERNNCWSEYQISSDIYQCNKDGNCGTMFRIVAGNPEKL